MKKVLLIISCSVLLIRCETETLVEVEKKYNWKTHEEFQYDNAAQMNSYATTDRLFFQGYSSFSSLMPNSIDHSDLPMDGNVSHYTSWWYELPSNKKLPICSDYFISYKEINGSVLFIPTMNPVTRNTHLLINIKDMDNTYAGFDFLNYHSGECISINAQNQALIPYVSIVDSKTSLKLALVDIVTKVKEEVYLDTIKTIIVNVPPENTSVIGLQTTGKYFFLTTNSKVYRIDNLGNVEEVLETRLNKIIEASGTLYGFDNENVYFSQDDGLTWNKEYLAPYYFSFLNYTKIDNRIIGYRFDQLWEIDLNEARLIVKELDNDGLEGLAITSISSFDSKIYLSTFSGVYYKELDEFFKYKYNN